MNTLNKNIVDQIVKKAKTKDGAILMVKVEKEKEEYEVSLKIRKYEKGSFVFYFGLENKRLNKTSKKIRIAFSNIFCDISFKEEFKINFIWGDGYFKTWAYLGDEKDVIEYFLHLQYRLRKWKIISIN